MGICSVQNHNRGEVMVGGKEGERKGPYTYLALAMAKRMMEGGMDGGRGKET